MLEQTNWQVGWGVPGGAPVALVLGVALFALAVLGSRPQTPVPSRRWLLVILRWLAADDASALAEVDLLSLHTLPRRRLHINLNTG